MTSFKALLGVLFSLLVTAIAVLGILLYKNNQHAINTSQEVQVAQDMLQLADEISSLSNDMQLESNAYLISKGAGSSVPYEFSRGALSEKLAQFRSLAGVHESSADSLDLLLNNLTAFTDEAFATATGEEYSEKKLLERVENNKLHRDRIRSLIQRFKDEEKKLLSARESAHRKSVEAFNSTFFSLLAGVFVLLITTFLIVRHSFNKRISAEENLRKANELFVKLFYESPIGIAITKAEDGTCIDCNGAYAELVNYDRDDIIGKTAVELQILQNEEERDEIVRKVKLHGVARDVETLLKPRNKKPIWASISIQALQVQGIPCFLCAILDMTNHKEAEEKIKKALAVEVELSKMKSDFVSMASHEFRTPLTSILSSSFLIDNYSVGENREKVLKHLGRINSSVKILTSILDEFLSLTKIEEGKVQPRPEMVELEKFMGNLCGNLKTFAKPGQRIKYTHNGDVSVLTDPVLLGSITNNLVSNAIKYSPANSDILISTTANGHLQLAVKDSGIGIPAEDQAHLFERFYRASNAGNVQGTGLGLHILKRYVDMLRGSIEVKSEQGRGSEFKITFDKIEPEDAKA